MKIPMKFPASLFLLAFASLGEPPPGPFEGFADMNVVASWGGESSGNVRVSFSRWGRRSEWEIGNAAFQKESGGLRYRIVQIHRADDPGQIYLVNDRTSTFAVTDENEWEEFGGKARGSATGGKKSFVVSRLGKDTVAGIPCERVKVTEAKLEMEVDACILRGSLPGNSFPSMPGVVQTEDWMKAIRNLGIDGCPIRLDVWQRGKTLLAVALVRLTVEALPKSLFRIPPGYRQTSLMGVLAQTSNQIKVVEEGEKEMEAALKEMTPEDRSRMKEILKLRPPKAD